MTTSHQAQTSSQKKHRSTQPDGSMIDNLFWYAHAWFAGGKQNSAYSIALAAFRLWVWGITTTHRSSIYLTLHA